MCLPANSNLMCLPCKRQSRLLPCSAAGGPPASVLLYPAVPVCGTLLPAGSASALPFAGGAVSPAATSVACTVVGLMAVTGTLHRG